MFKKKKKSTEEIIGSLHIPSEEPKRFFKSMISTIKGWFKHQQQQNHNYEQEKTIKRSQSLHLSKTDQTRVQYLCQKQNSYPRVQRNFTTPTNQLNAILNNDKEIEHVWFNSSVGLKAMKEPPLKEVEIWDDEFNVELKIPDLVLHNQGKLVEDANNLKLFSLHIQDLILVLSNIDGLYNGLLESESNRIPLDVLEREYRTHVKSARHLIEQAKESNDVTIVKIAHVDSAALDLDWDEEFLVNDKTNSELENGDHYFDGETLCTMIVQVQYLKEIMNSYLVCLRHEAVRSN